MVAYVTRVTRSGMLKALSEDYVRTARAKGLPSRLVVWRHALRNVLIPVVTVIGLYLGVLIGNAVLTEIVFNRPGLGKLIVTGAEPARLRAAPGPHGGHRARHRSRQHPHRPDLWSRRSAGEDRMSAIATEIATAPAPAVIGAPSAWQRATRSGGLAVGVVLVVAMVLVALLAPWISPYDPDEQNVLMKLEPPSWPSTSFGTDAFGRDVLSRVIWGARVSLFVGSVATLAGILIGTVIGIISGYYGGIVDKLITAATDILLSFPQLIMGLILVAVLGPTLFNLILAIAITAVPAFIRVARGSTLAMKERDFVDACRALGYGDLRIMFLHVLPNIMDEVVVMGSLWLAAAIRTESTLAFIGLGVPPPTATWGGIIREGFDNLLDAPWLSIFPSLAILVVMIALNLVGDGLRDATDPRTPQ